MPHALSRSKSRRFFPVVVAGTAQHAYQDKTRSSRTGWLSRQEHPRLERVFRRFAEVLGIDDSLLQHSGKGASAERLQVVHYKPGQEYQATLARLPSPRPPHHRPKAALDVAEWGAAAHR